MIKFQQSQALTSHFESFWSIVQKVQFQPTFSSFVYYPSWLCPPTGNFWIAWTPGVCQRPPLSKGQHLNLRKQQNLSSFWPSSQSLKLDPLTVVHCHKWLSRFDPNFLLALMLSKYLQVHPLQGQNVLRNGCDVGGDLCPEIQKMYINVVLLVKQHFIKHRMNSNIIFRTLNELEQVHLLKFKHPIFGFEWSDIEHQT